MKRPAIDALKAAYAQIEAHRFTPTHEQALETAVRALGTLFDVPLRIGTRLANGLVGIEARKTAEEKLIHGFGPHLAALLNEVPTDANPGYEGRTARTNVVIAGNGFTYLTRESLEHVLRRAIELHPSTVYLSSLADPNESRHLCGMVRTAFDAAMMDRNFPLYRMTFGQRAELALDEMTPHAGQASRELFIHLSELPQSPELSAFLQLTRWTRDARGNVAPKAATPSPGQDHTPSP